MCFIYLDDILIVNTTPPGSGKGFTVHDANLGRLWYGNQLRKNHFNTFTVRGPFGVFPQFKGRNFGSAQTQIKSSPKRTGNLFDTQNFDMSKNGCNFGISTKFFNGHALPQGIHRLHERICQSAGVFGMGFSSGHSTPFETGGKRFTSLTTTWSGDHLWKKLPVRK